MLFFLLCLDVFGERALFSVFGALRDVDFVHVQGRLWEYEMKGFHLLAQFGPAWAAIAAASLWIFGIMCSLRVRSDSGLGGKWTSWCFQYCAIAVSSHSFCMVVAYAPVSVLCSLLVSTGPRIMRSLLDSSEISPGHYIHVPLR